jgi:CheY-like chemotaxis protein
MSGDGKVRVLVVEDDEGSASDYLRWLAAAGREVTRASARSDAVTAARASRPDVVLLDLQIPSEPGAADEGVEHGFATLDELLRDDPFRPVVIVTAHSNNRELTRRVYQRNHGGQFVFKDALELERSLLDAVTVAARHPAYLMSRVVKEFRALVVASHPEEVYQQFIAEHWREILGPDYREVHAKYPVGQGGIVDLYAIRHDGFPDLWELKLPKDVVLKEYGAKDYSAGWLHHTERCAAAMGQLMAYFDIAERTRDTSSNSIESRRGIDVKSHRPNGFVVIGRYADDPRRAAREREHLRMFNSFLAGLTVLTYDDLVERAERYLTFLQQYRNGDGPRSGP